MSCPMNCEEFQQRMLADEVSAAEREEHLRNCQECRQYAAVLDAIQMPEIPEELEVRVKEACRGELERLNCRTPHPWNAFIYSVAALFAAVAVLSVLHTHNAGKSAYAEVMDAELVSGIQMDEDESGFIEFELELIASGM